MLLLSCVYLVLVGVILLQSITGVACHVPKAHRVTETEKDQILDLYNTYICFEASGDMDMKRIVG